MKHFIILIAFISSLPVFAQLPGTNPKPSRWFITYGTGYSFISGQGQTYQYSHTGGNDWVAATAFSYGKGLNIGAGIGYRFTPHLSADIRLSYLFGGKRRIDNSFYNDTSASPYKETEKMTFWANMLRINPSLIFSTDIKRISPYLKLGVMFGFGKANSMQEASRTYTGSYSETLITQWTYSGLNAVGITSNLGLQFHLDEETHFYMEFSHINMGGTFKNGTLVQATDNGQDFLPYLNTSDKQIIFLDRLPGQSTQPYASSPNKPTNVLRTKRPFDSMGFNIGMIFNL